MTSQYPDGNITNEKDGYLGTFSRRPITNDLLEDYIRSGEAVGGFTFIDYIDGYLYSFETCGDIEIYNKDYLDEWSNMIEELRPIAVNNQANPLNPSPEQAYLKELYGFTHSSFPLTTSRYTPDDNSLDYYLLSPNDAYTSSIIGLSSEDTIANQGIFLCQKDTAYYTSCTSYNVLWSDPNGPEPDVYHTGKTAYDIGMYMITHIMGQQDFIDSLYIVLYPDAYYPIMYHYTPQEAQTDISSQITATINKTKKTFEFLYDSSVIASFPISDDLDISSITNIYYKIDFTGSDNSLPTLTCQPFLYADNDIAPINLEWTFTFEVNYDYKNQDFTLALIQ